MTKANNLEVQAQQVWSTSDIQQKKSIILEMIDNFKYKDRQEHFRDVVHYTDRAARLDKLAADLMLADVDKTIKL